MKHITVIAVCIALSVANARLVAAADQPQAASTAATEGSATSEDELHFVSVLTLQGEIVSVDPAKRLLTLKGPKNEVITLETRNQEDLAEHKLGDHVLVRYFEGAQIRKRVPGKVVPVDSLKDGMIEAEPGGSSGKPRALAASVERVDLANQEITLTGPDGSLETIIVSNPHYLSHIKVGDRVVVTHPEGLALSVERGNR